MLCAKDYNEVLYLLSFLSEKEYSKIPQNEIKFLKENSIKQYEFSNDFNYTKVSCNALAIYVRLYRDYIANDQEKTLINEILELNSTNK